LEQHIGLEEEVVIEDSKTAIVKVEANFLADWGSMVFWEGWNIIE